MWRQKIRKANWPKASEVLAPKKSGRTHIRALSDSVSTLKNLFGPSEGAKPDLGSIEEHGVVPRAETKASKSASLQPEEGQAAISNGEVVGTTGNATPVVSAAPVLNRRRSYVDDAPDHLRVKAKVNLPENEVAVYSNLMINILRGEGEEPPMEAVSVVVSSCSVYIYPQNSYEECTTKFGFERIHSVRDSEAANIFTFCVPSLPQRKIKLHCDGNGKRECLGILMRFYTAFMHSPLTKVFCRDEAPRALNKAKKRWKAAFAKTRAVAGFKAAVAVSNYNKGAMVVANAGQKTCNYCHQVIAKSDRLKRHGEITYHMECDPYERQRNPAGARKLSVASRAPSARKTKKRDAKVERKAARAQRREERAAIRLAKFEDRKEAILQKKKNLMAKLEKREKERLDRATFCEGCKDEFRGGNYYACCGGIWHPACFCCVTCGAAFDPRQGYFIKNGKPVCEEHSYDEDNWRDVAAKNVNTLVTKVSEAKHAAALSISQPRSLPSVRKKKGTKATPRDADAVKKNDEFTSSSNPLHALQIAQPGSLPISPIVKKKKAAAHGRVKKGESRQEPSPSQELDQYLSYSAGSQRNLLEGSRGRATPEKRHSPPPAPVGMKKKRVQQMQASEKRKAPPPSPHCRPEEFKRAKKRAQQKREAPLSPRGKKGTWLSDTAVSLQRRRPPPPTPKREEDQRSAAQKKWKGPPRVGRLARM